MRTLALLVVLALTLSCNGQSIWDHINEEEDYTQFRSEIMSAPNDLDGALDSTTKYTVFAPMNGDFDRDDIEVQLHVFKGERTNWQNEELISGDETLYGEDTFVRVFTSGNNVWLCSDGCLRTSTTSDTDLSNGVVYASDGELAAAEVYTVEEAINHESSLTTWRFLLSLVPEVNDLLEDENSEITVLVPYDNFFSSDGSSKFLQCLEDVDSREYLLDLARFSVINDLVPTFLWSTSESTLYGGTERLSYDGDANEVNGADILKTIYATNGIIHIIDQVLSPSIYDEEWYFDHCRTTWDFLLDQPELSDLRKVYSENGIKSELEMILRSNGKLTLFAPTDEALAAWEGGEFPTRLHVQYNGKIFLSELDDQHTIPVVMTVTTNSFIHVFFDDLNKRQDGEDLTGVQVTLCSENCVHVVSHDNEELNGVVHVTDGVLAPAAYSSIAEVVAEDTMNSTLLTAALGLTELTGALDNAHLKYTLFLPTDVAFYETFDEDELACLTDGEHNFELQLILLAHVVPGIYPSFRVVPGDLISLNNETLTVELSVSGVSVDGANVTSVDIFTKNGVIHTIDRVIIPDGYTTCAGGSLVISATLLFFVLASFLF